MNECCRHIEYGRWKRPRCCRFAGGGNEGDEEDDLHSETCVTSDDCTLGSLPELFALNDVYYMEFVLIIESQRRRARFEVSISFSLYYGLRGGRTRINARIN